MMKKPQGEGLLMLLGGCAAGGLIGYFVGKSAGIASYNAALAAPSGSSPPSGTNTGGTNTGGTTTSSGS